MAEQRIADLGANAIFASVPLTNLRTLNLKSNNLTDACCAALDELLNAKGTCYLEVLVLSKNNFTNKGLSVFLPGLEANTTLHALDLSHNFIDVMGMRALRDSLEDNQGLQGISLVGNTSQDDCGCEEFLRTRVLRQISADLNDNKDFFKQYEAHGIKSVDGKQPGTHMFYLHLHSNIVTYSIHNNALSLQCYGMLFAFFLLPRSVYV